MSEDKYDAIIIGAGPAGSACAYTLAKAGKNVALIERGDTPGAKNVTGGRLYTYALEVLDEGLFREAALERKVTHEQIMVLDQNSAITIDYHNPAFNAEGKPPQSYTILRAVFDEWLAGKAEEMGTTLACGIRVDKLIEKGGKIVGVTAGEDEMYAEIVIAADGVNSFMAQRAGLTGDLTAHAVGVGVKEIIELPAKTINERFNLREEEGAARLMLGCTEGIRGGGFLYTNKESVSLGCVFMLEEAGKHHKRVHEIFQNLKMHPGIFPLIEGGKTVEYGAHLVSEVGCRGIPPKLHRDGFLVVGDAAGFVISTGYSIRGIDLAILSGIAAARAVIEEDAVKVGAAYMRELESLKLIPAMKAASRYPDLLEMSRIYSTYPKMASDIFGTLFTVNGDVPEGMVKRIMRLPKENGVSILQLIKDGWGGYRAL